MFQKRYLAVALTMAIALSFVGVSSTSAQEAINPTGWVQPDGSQPLWYSFKVGKVEDKSNTNITITASSRSSNEPSFYVLDSGNWGSGDNLEEDDWFGMSITLDSGAAQWRGDLVPGTYMVRLSSNGNSEVRLGISGEAVHSVKILSGAVAPNEIARFSPDESADAPITEVVTSPAEPVPGQWISCESNEPQIFTFTVGKVEDETTQRVTISLGTGPFDNGGRFQVFTAGEAPRASGAPVEGDWFGTSDSTDDGRQTWAGELVAGGYDVRVEPLGVKECRLGVSGQTVGY